MADGSLFYLFDMRYILFLDLLFNPILFALSCLFFFLDLQKKMTKMNNQFFFNIIINF